MLALAKINPLRGPELALLSGGVCRLFGKHRAARIPLRELPRPGAADHRALLCEMLRAIFRRDYQTFSCANCEHRTLHFDSAVAAYRSRGPVRKLVHDFKYGRQRHLRHPLAEWLGETMRDPRLHGRRFDLIVPVPLHPARQRERGFNQATLLAELLAPRVAVPLRLALERIRYTKTQTAYDRAERMENLRDAFRLRKNMNVRQLHVLLIDDVLTTGSTLSECARVLKEAGAISVYAATAARA